MAAALALSAGQPVAILARGRTYMKVKGKRAYLYRAVNSRGDTIDFHLSQTRNAKAAKRFLGKALRACKEWEKPFVINTDKAGRHCQAIRELKKEGRCPSDTDHRQVKYLNNVVEADHGKLKRLIKPTPGFKSMKTAYATIKHPCFEASPDSVSFDGFLGIRARVFHRLSTSGRPSGHAEAGRPRCHDRPVDSFLPGGPPRDAARPDVRWRPPPRSCLPTCAGRAAVRWQ